MGHEGIGDGAVIGANAVVITDVPAGALAVGVPAYIAPGRAAERRISRTLSLEGIPA